MLTNLKSLLVENGFFGEWAQLRFKIYHKDDGSPFFASISEWKTFSEDEVHHKLGVVFDTTQPHPHIYEIYADCGDKQIHLTTKLGGSCMKVSVVYGTVDEVKTTLDVSAFGLMPGCHV